MTDLKAGNKDLSNVSSSSDVGTGEHKVVQYEQLIGDLGKMVREVYGDIDSKITSKLEEVSKKMEEVREELKKHEEEEEARRKEEEISKREEEVSRKEEEVKRKEEEVGKPAIFGTKTEEAKKEASSAPKVVYKPIFVVRKQTAASKDEEEVKKRREERAKKLEEINRKMEDRRKKLAYEAGATAPAVQGKGQQTTVEDKPPTNDASALVQIPGLTEAKPAWLADILSASKKSDAVFNG